MSSSIAIVIDAPNFAAALPRFQLTQLPSPIERATRLEEHLRSEGLTPPRIFVKRDDLLGLALGGNKIRNLELTIGAALAAGATDVVTVGRAQSNHCRLTAAACAKAGLRSHIVMSGESPRVASGNLLLCRLFGAELVFTGTDDRATRQAMAQQVVEDVERAGQRAHFVAVGGSDPVGAVGHALAAREIVEQMRDRDEPLDAIVVATATAGTQAGMLAGLLKLESKTAVHGFAVNKPAGETAADVHRLGTDVARLIGAGAMDERRILVDDSQLGEGYGAPTRAGEEATRLFARLEGLILDRVYTAKAFAGLLVMVRQRRWHDGQGIVFIHTGGVPVLFT